MRRLDRRQAGQDHEGQECRQQRQRRRRSPASKRRDAPAAGLGNWRSQASRLPLRQWSWAMVRWAVRHSSGRSPTDAFVQQCCRIATIPRRAGVFKPSLHDRGCSPNRRRLSRRSGTTWMSRSRIFLRRVLRLTRAGRRRGSGCRAWPPGRRQQRYFDLPQDAVVEARRRQAVREAGEMRARWRSTAPPRLSIVCGCAARWTYRRRRQFGLDHREP